MNLDALTLPKDRLLDALQVRIARRNEQISARRGCVRVTQSSGRSWKPSLPSAAIDR